MGEAEGIVCWCVNVYVYLGETDRALAWEESCMLISLCVLVWASVRIRAIGKKKNLKMSHYLLINHLFDRKTDLATPSLCVCAVVCQKHTRLHNWLINSLFKGNETPVNITTHILALNS